MFENKGGHRGATSYSATRTAIFRDPFAYEKGSERMTQLVWKEWNAPVCAITHSSIANRSRIWGMYSTAQNTQLASSEYKLLINGDYEIFWQNVKTQPFLFFFPFFAFLFLNTWAALSDLCCEARYFWFSQTSLFRKVSSTANCQSEVLHQMRWNAYFPMPACFKKKILLNAELP